jgi:hypothetical protein
MRYVIVDLDGAARDHLSDPADVREVLREAEVDVAGSATELYVLVYDDDGERVGEPERGDEFLGVIVRETADWANRERATFEVVAGASR